ncbi:MAG TPA: HRDC domain-containing protein [Candidatus Sumerlaeota bacterium]|nr:HRDC domain-containing protein [Candidatus Sumerlaeota bacterium]
MSESYQYIDSDSALAALLECINSANDIALDTEADSLHHYFEKVCLIQISVDGRDFIIDPLSPLNLSPLFDALSTKNIILHGADYDLRMLRFCYHFHPGRPVFDTMLAAQLAGFDQFGLAALVEHFFNMTLDKKGQRSDWSQRPLPPHLLEYARRDTHFLKDLKDQLYQMLRNLGRGEWHEEWCRRTVEAAGEENHRDPDQAWRIRGVGNLSRRELAVFRDLWLWRDQEARDADRPAFRVLSNTALIELAQAGALTKGQDPADIIPLPRNCRGRRLDALRRALRRGESRPQEEWPPARIRESIPEMDDLLLEIQGALKEECLAVAKELALAPSLIAPRAALARIARERPGSPEEVMQSCGLMSWQAMLMMDGIRRVFDRYKAPAEAAS